MFLVEQPALQVIKDSCIHYGMTYDGLKKGTTFLLGPGGKVGPIKLCGALNLFAFPTTFPTKPDCGWLLFDHIVDFHPNGKQTLVQFTNGFEIVIDLPVHLMENRYHMSTKLISKWTHTLAGKLYYELEGRTDGLYIHKLNQSDLNYTMDECE